MSERTEPAPEIGMGATLQMGTEQYAFTIREVRANGRIIIATADRAGALYVGERYRDPSF